MKVSRSQFLILSLLTVCAILWLLLLTCYRENWGFWQSPKDYHFLSKEYTGWFRDYIHDYHGATLYFTLFLYVGWLGIFWRQITDSTCARVALLGMTLLLGLTLGVLVSNNLIGYLDSGQLHRKTHLQTRD